MLEAESPLTDDRRPRLGNDEVSEQEVVEQHFHVELRREMLERPAPEDAADHGAAVEQGLLLRGQVVDAGGDHRLKRVGDPRRGSLAVALEQHPDRLLDEQRVALGLREHVLPRVGRERVVGKQRSEQLLALVMAKRVELDRRRAHAASAPSGANVEQLGPGEADEQERRLAHPGGQVLDELEQRLLGPVDVLEDEHERLNVGELVGPGTGCPGDLLRAALLLDGVEDAGGEREQVGDGLVLTALAQLLDRLANGVVVGDPGRRLHHLGERPVGDPLAVGQAAAGQHGRALERADELTDKAALADPRLAVNGDEVRAPVARGTLEGVGEQVELGFAADQRRDDGRARGDLRAVDGADHAPGGELPGAALDLDRLDLLDLDRVEREPPRCRTDQDLHRAGGLLEPCREVDRLAGRERRVRRVDDDLTGLDPDPRLEPELLHAVEDPDRGADRALGVVLVCLGDSEGGQHGVAGELLDDAAVRRHAVRDVLEELRHAATHDLRIGGRDERGRTDQVDEQHGCELAFHL